ncbi:P2Y purinoceptor 2-like isoform X1 [Poecile atricapillus]|uniref:P2Y purinoceptor 2-like isoform X1 n=1 Tax=Poecile atricapillus TaxID=48891 RepID=UPI00273859EF|nr:P2Y purinoceptor 2-like isoform X1 [Poecile atricapillus]XP_058711238.1 P2Y purinoceptor 2-like isoform X1 [Poecile atricapillus]
MAGISWAEGVSNGTHFPISNGTKASSGGALGADLQHSLFAVSYSTVLVLGLAGNALSLSLLSCRVKPLSHSYILLLHLALLDTLFLAVLPLQIHAQLLGDTWTFGDTACRVTQALCCLHVSLSVAFFGCLGLDLWLAVLHPFTSIQLRATHYMLVAAALWVVALAATVPLVLHSRGVRSCFGNFPGSWAHPTAPHTILAFIFGVAVPFSIILLGLPLVARSVWQSRRRAARRKALGTISIMLGICAICFLPQHLTQLLQFLRGIQEEPLPSLIPEIQRVTEALASCSCCLNPLLYHFHSSSRAWHCPFRFSLRSKRVFTICDHNFGDPSWGYKSGQRHGRKIHGGWNQLIHSTLWEILPALERDWFYQPSTIMDKGKKMDWRLFVVDPEGKMGN